MAVRSIAAGEMIPFFPSLPTYAIAKTTTNPTTYATTPTSRSGASEYEYALAEDDALLALALLALALRGSDRPRAAAAPTPPCCCCCCCCWWWWP